MFRQTNKTGLLDVTEKHNNAGNKKRIVVNIERTVIQDFFDQVEGACCAKEIY